VVFDAPRTEGSALFIRGAELSGVEFNGLSVTDLIIEDSGSVQRWGGPITDLRLRGTTAQTVRINGRNRAFPNLSIERLNATRRFEMIYNPGDAKNSRTVLSAVTTPSARIESWRTWRPNDPVTLRINSSTFGALNI